jgi:hypothetical protein
MTVGLDNDEVSCNVMGGAWCWLFASSSAADQQLLPN